MLGAQRNRSTAWRKRAPSPARSSCPAGASPTRRCPEIRGQEILGLARSQRCLRWARLCRAAYARSCPVKVGAAGVCLEHRSAPASMPASRSHLINRSVGPRPSEAVSGEERERGDTRESIVEFERRCITPPQPAEARMVYEMASNSMIRLPALHGSTADSSMCSRHTPAAFECNGPSCPKKKLNGPPAPRQPPRRVQSVKTTSSSASGGFETRPYVGGARLRRATHSFHHFARLYVISTTL